LDQTSEAPVQWSLSRQACRDPWPQNETARHLVGCFAFLGSANLSS